MTAASGKLSDIPDDIGLGYLKVPCSLKKKQKAHGFVSGSYTHKVCIYCKGEDVDIDASMHPSQRKHDKPHRITVTINKSEHSVVGNYCSCKIGQKADRLCSHGVALLLLLEQWKIAGYKEIPALLTCTSLPQQWDKPRGDKINPEPVSAMVVNRPSNTNRKRRPILPSFNDNRKIQVTTDDISALQSLKGTPISYLVGDTDVSYTTTQYGEVPVGAAMCYHAPLIQPLYTPRQEAGCGDILFPFSVPLSEPVDALLQQHQHEWSHLSLTREEAQSLERRTIAQTLSTEWFSERSKRITASSFGQIMTRKKDVNESFLCNTFRKGPFHSSATSYGIANEKHAKAMYMRNTGAHLHEVGLVVNPSFPFIGASPDEIACKDGKSYIMEIKCPYSARDLTINDAINKTKDFFLIKDGTEIKLKRSHKHYYQVQGQLLVSGASECHFITYTRKDFHCEIIVPDGNVMEKMLSTLVDFYRCHFKAYINKAI